MGQHQLTESFITVQVARLRTIPFKPEQKADVGAFVEEAKRILKKSAKSEDHCRRIVDHVVDSAKGFPAPAALLEAAASVPERPAEPAPAACAECSGTGYQVIERLAFNAASQSELLTSAVEYCTCTRGRWLAQKATDRKESA